MDRFKFCIRPVAVFAGVIGGIQSIAWIALCITGITAYYCHMDLDSRPNALGSLMELTFFKVYFNGPCDQVIQQAVDFNALEGLNVVQPIGVHGMIWAYLMLSFFWLISSVTLLTMVQPQYIKYANIFLFIWMALTALISILDLTVGILFGLDYGTFMTAAYDIELTTPIIQSADIVLLAAQGAAGIMMGVAFRGFLLWLLNVVLVCYFFTQTLRISDFNRRQATGFVGADNNGFDKIGEPYGFSHNNQSRANPMWFPSTDRQSTNAQPPYPTIPHAHVETRNRNNAALNSIDRRREDEVVLRNNVVREIHDRNSMTAPVTRKNEPNPDYSPPMPRHNNPYDRQRSMMRTSRF